MRNKQKGFTLIELLVVIGMMTIITSALIINFKAGDRSKRVNLTKDTIISALRQAQNYTLSGKQIPLPAVAPHVRGNTRCASNNAPVSYWVEMHANSNNLDIMAEDTCGAVMRIQTYNLVQGTKFSPNNTFFTVRNAGNFSSPDLAVRFQTPFATMTVATIAAPLSGDFVTFSNSVVTFEHNDGLPEKTVTVDGISGKID
jgi:prepilin-type N-terminal cleavage/methylation domain-containing protein